ncbi:MAG: pyridoxal phosphate-dependent aminotransferase, partial [Alphaproteobacteria bacterium]
MALKVSKRSDISSFIVMDVMRQANELEAQGQAIYHMEVGQPGTPAPKSALDAVSREMANDKLGYTLALGREDLRVSISNMYAERYGKQIPASRIVITTGSSSGFILSFLAAFDVGDKVALASPGYPAYRNILKALGIQVVDILADLEDGFQPTPEKLDEAITKHGKLDGLIIASPSNPCGSMLGESQFDALTAYCQQNSIRMISDEIYHGVGFGKKEFTAANNPDAIVVNSFSKYYSMTGWRIGWLVVPEDLLRPMECLAQNLFICPPHVSQVAALGALSAAPELDQHIQVYSKNRGLVLGALAKAGIEKI